MLTGTYRDLFTAIATSAAGLTGLLFVVVTVAERRTETSLPGVIQQVREAAALLSFTSALSVSLFGLVPKTNVGYPAVAVAIIGILFSAAAVRSIVSTSSPRDPSARHLALTVILLLVFGAELAAGIGLLQHADNTGVVGLGLLSNLLIASLLIGIARAWELVGGRDTGVVASLAVLMGRGSVARSSVPAPGADDVFGISEPDEPRP
jgi:hypothetical protein